MSDDQSTARLGWLLVIGVLTVLWEYQMYWQLRSIDASLKAMEAKVPNE